VWNGIDVSRWMKTATSAAAPPPPPQPPPHHTPPHSHHSGHFASDFATPPPPMEEVSAAASDSIMSFVIGLVLLVVVIGLAIWLSRMMLKCGEVTCRACYHGIRIAVYVGMVWIFVCFYDYFFPFPMLREWGSYLWTILSTLLRRNAIQQTMHQAWNHALGAPPGPQPLQLPQPGDYVPVAPPAPPPPPPGYGARPHRIPYANGGVPAEWDPNYMPPHPRDPRLGVAR